jgi:peptide/nickel transport system permease protein
VISLLRFILTRVGFMVVSLVAVSLITFTLMHLAPGNFFDITTVTTIGGDVEATQRITKLWEEKYGLDKPLWQQYLKYMWDLVRLKVGPSFKYPTMTVEEIIARSFPTSFKVAMISMVVSLIVGIPLGIISGLRKGTAIDYTITTISLMGVALPSYAIASLLIILFCLILGVLPTAGWGQPKHYIIPVLALAAGSIASNARYLRVTLVEELNLDYIRTAYAKGGTERTVVFKHALRNSLIPLITIIGPRLASMMMGTLIIEQMFRIPGLGQYFIISAQTRDYPLLMTTTLFYAALIMFMNLLVDISYALLDPRIRYERS